MQDNHEIRPGDWVRHRSGGPAMLVHARSLNLAYCSWNEAEQAHHATFAVEQLCPAEAPAPGEPAPPAPLNALKSALQAADRHPPLPPSGFGDLGNTR